MGGDWTPDGKSIYNDETNAHIAQPAEHVLGKNGVVGSIPTVGLK
jgi:hypothetical protein